MTMPASGLAASVSAAVQALDSMPPVERARAIPGLIEACRRLQGQLSAERAGAMREATTGPGAISRAELGRQLDLSRSKVTEALGPKPAL